MSVDVEFVDEPVELIGVLYGVTTWMFEGEEVKGPGSARCACMMM